MLTRAGQLQQQQQQEQLFRSPLYPSNQLWGPTSEGFASFLFNRNDKGIIRYGFKGGEIKRSFLGLI